MAVIRSVEGVVQPDFFQFHVFGNDTWTADEVSAVDYEPRLWSTGGFAYVGTGSQHHPTPFRLEVFDVPPDAPPAEPWQHIASTSLRTDGTIAVHHWDHVGNPPVATVTVPAGEVRLRVQWAGLDPDGSTDGGREHLVIQVWAEPASLPVVERCWPLWEVPPLADVAPDGRRQIEGGDAVQAIWPSLTVMGIFARPWPPLPGGGEDTRLERVMHDPAADIWWAEGYGFRPLLREVSAAEAQELMQRSDFTSIDDLRRELE